MAKTLLFPACCLLTLLSLAGSISTYAQRNLLGIELVIQMRELDQAPLWHLLSSVAPGSELLTRNSPRLSVVESDGASLRLQGIFDIGKQHWQAGEANLKRAVELEHARAITRYWLGVAQYGLGKRDAAVENWAASQSLPYLLQVAAELLRQNHPAAASDLYRVGFEVAQRTVGPLPATSDLAHAYRNVGKLALEAGQLESASEYLEKAVSLNPRRTLYRMELGQLYAVQGRYDQALQQAVALIEIEPASPAWSTVAGDYHLHLGELPQAERAFLDALMKMGNGDDNDRCWHARAWLGLSSVYATREVWESSLSAVLQAARVNGGISQGWRSLFALRFQTALAAEPERIDWYLLIGAMYEEAGDPPAAMQYYEAASERWPNDAQINERIAHLPQNAVLAQGACP